MMFLSKAYSSNCHHSLHVFNTICSDSGVPIAHEKTVEPTHDLTFLGIELDLHNLTMQLPTEKLNLLNTSLGFFLQAKESVLERIVVAYWSIKLCVQGSCTWPWFLPAPYKFNNRHNQTIPLNQSYKNIKADLRIWQEFLKSVILFQTMGT